jgi:hypothetical protein
MPCCHDVTLWLRVGAARKGSSALSSEGRLHENRRFARRRFVVQTRRVRWFLTDKGMPTAGLIIAAVLLLVGIVMFAATTVADGTHAGGLTLIFVGGFGVVLCVFILLDLARRH